MWKYLAVLALLAVASATPLTPVLAQDTASKAYNGIPTNKTIWDGIYTEDQAAAGQMIYASGCSVCHGKQLEGVPDEGNPALAAASFMIEWTARPWPIWCAISTPRPMTSPAISIPSPASSWPPSSWT